MGTANRRLSACTMITPASAVNDSRKSKKILRSVHA